MIEETKISFLTEAISDAQEIIRFIETKTGIVVTITGAYLVVIFTDTENIIKYISYYNCWFFLFLTLFIFNLIACLIVIVRIIKPSSDPNKNIELGGVSKPSLQFYIAPNNYSRLHQFRNTNNHKLETSFSKYKVELQSAGLTEILDSLTMELLKVSFIRNIKSDRFKFLIWLMISTTACFFITFILYSMQTENAKTVIEMIKNSHHIIHSCSN
jgi:uncharacterized protein YpmS